VIVCLCDIRITVFCVLFFTSLSVGFMLKMHKLGAIQNK
jgi:hypothetical protein